MARELSDLSYKGQVNDAAGLFEVFGSHATAMWIVTAKDRNEWADEIWEKGDVPLTPVSRGHFLKDYSSEARYCSLCGTLVGMEDTKFIRFCPVCGNKWARK